MADKKPKGKRKNEEALYFWPNFLNIWQVNHQIVSSFLKPRTAAEWNRDGGRDLRPFDVDLFLDDAPEGMKDAASQYAALMVDLGKPPISKKRWIEEVKLTEDILENEPIETVSVVYFSKYISFFISIYIAENIYFLTQFRILEIVCNFHLAIHGSHDAACPRNKCFSDVWPKAGAIFLKKFDDEIFKR